MRSLQKGIVKKFDRSLFVSYSSAGRRQQVAPCEREPR
jgi:hypothetical protein